jgi:hypothetical protein
MNALEVPLAAGGGRSSKQIEMRAAKLHIHGMLLRPEGDAAAGPAVLALRAAKIHAYAEPRVTRQRKFQSMERALHRKSVFCSRRPAY